MCTFLSDLSTGKKLHILPILYTILNIFLLMNHIFPCYSILEWIRYLLPL